MAKSSIVDVWFYVDPESEKIDSVICWFPLGMSVREDSDWTITDKEDAGIYDKLANDDVYQLDWETSPVTITPDFDFNDYENNHEALKLYDKGELTLEKLGEYAEKIKTASDYTTEGDDLEVED